MTTTEIKQFPNAKRPRGEYLCSECASRMRIEEFSGGVDETCLTANCSLIKMDDDGKFLGYIDPISCNGYKCIAPLVNILMFMDYLCHDRRKAVLETIKSSTGLERAKLMNQIYMDCVAHTNLSAKSEREKLGESQFVHRLIREGKLEA